MEKENGMNNKRGCSTEKLATTIIYCDVPSGITAWICEFFCLSLRNSRRITSGRTRRPWRRLATAHFSLKNLLKSPDISKCRSLVSSWVKWQNEGCLRRLGDSSASCRGLDLQAVGGRSDELVFRPRRDLVDSRLTCAEPRLCPPSGFSETYCSPFLLISIFPPISWLCFASFPPTVHGFTSQAPWTLDDNSDHSLWSPGCDLRLIEGREIWVTTLVIAVCLLSAQGRVTRCALLPVWQHLQAFFAAHADGKAAWTGTGNEMAVTLTCILVFFSQSKWEKLDVSLALLTCFSLYSSSLNRW